MGAVADHEAGFAVLSAGGQSVEFFQEGERVDDDAGSDDGRDVWLEDAGGEQAEFVGASIEADGVSGIVTALVTDDDLVAFCQDIDDFAFGFVAPLQTNHGSCRH